MKYSATLLSRFASCVRVLFFGVALAAALTASSPRVSAQEPTPTPTPVSDILVLKSGDETAVPGGQINYDVIVTNAGPDDAKDVVLSDPLPPHTTMGTFSSSQGSASFDGAVVTVNFGTIRAFESARLLLTVNVDANTDPGTTITNTAIANSSSTDSDLSNNQGSTSTQIVAPSAELSIGKQGPDTADVGSQITYTITVFNFGTLDATNVIVSDPIPAHTTFNFASSSQGPTPTSDGTTVTANLGTIAAGGSASVSVTLTINGDTPRGTTIVNTAIITTQTPERNTEDNTATAFTDVTGGVFAGDLIISEFRLRGPGIGVTGAPKDDTGAFGRPAASSKKLIGRPSPDVVASNSALDEFVEIYNNTDSPITIQTFDDSTGFAVAASDGSVRFVIPNGTTIPARGHFLGVNSGYSLSGYPSANNGGPGSTATGDISYTGDIPDNAGIALFRTSISGNFSMNSRLDAVGSTAETNALYKEGNGYPALTNTTPTDYSFYRDMCGKSGSTSNPAPCTQFTPRDTDNNAADFVFVDTDGTNLGAGQRLGAPGPENLASPIQSNDSIRGFLLDSTKSNEVSPNRVRDVTPGPASTSTFGTLDVRRRIVNNSEVPVTRLRFRIVDISTFFAPIETADLRAITAPQIVVNGINDPSTCGGSTPCTVTVRGTILETPPSQPFGGAFNSSLSDGLVTLQTPLFPGQSINLRFLFGVQKTGAFRVLLNIETLNESQIFQQPVKAKSK